MNRNFKLGILIAIIVIALMGCKKTPPDDPPLIDSFITNYNTFFVNKILEKK